MITKVVKYKTADGLVFDTEYDAFKHTKFTDTLLELEAMLGELPKKWPEHTPYYIQRHKNTVRVIKERLYKLLKVKPTEEFGYLSVTYKDPEYLQLRNLLSRLALIDRDGREFSSLYFKTNPKQCRGEYRK